MVNLFRKLWNDTRGNVLLIAAVAMPLVVGAAGLATDTIQWTMWKRQLQRAADSAAIAGVYERQSNAGSTSKVSAAVTRDLAINNHAWMAQKTGYPQIDTTVTGTNWVNPVQVKLAVQQSLTFSSMFLSAAPTITATATAAGVSVGDPCILATSKTAKNALYFSGNAEVYMPDCPVFSNSNNSNSAAAKGSAKVTAKSVGGVGGVASSNNFTVGAYYPYSTEVDDPYSSITPQPSDMNCATGSKKDLDENTTAATLSTNNCFSSLTVGPGKSLSIPDSYVGPIYISGGDVKFQGDFTCAHCTIVLTNSDPDATKIGNVTANAGTNVNITAPDTGVYAGIAIFQDRRASSSCNGCNNKINGNSTSLIQGAIYFPNQDLDYNGTGNTTAICTRFIGSTVTFSGNSGTNQFKALKDCPNFAKDSTVVIVRLVQ